MIVLMKSDKSLVISKNSQIYQKESVVDKLLFLLPAYYNGIDLSEFTFQLTYLDPEGGRHTELLTADDESYKENFISYQLPVDSEITKYTGAVTLSLSGTWLDSETMKQYVIKTGTLQISIAPLSTLYEFVPDESLDVIDQRILQLNGKIEALEKLEERLDKEIPDDLSVDSDNILRLTVDGSAIGDGVEVLTNVQDNDGSVDGILDISGAEDIDPGSEQSVGIIDL